MAASSKGVVWALIAAVLVCAAAANRASATMGSRPLAGPRVAVVLTSSELRDRLSPQPQLRFSTSGIAGVPTIRVDDSARYQRISGFGAGMTDTSAWLIHNELSPSSRARLMKRLFGAHGIALGFLRLPIGASDFTAAERPYSYDDLPPGQTDPPLAHFTIAHDFPYIIPALRQALTVNPRLQILGTLWSAPPWMKANDAFNNLSHLGVLMPSAYRPLARYFVKFIEAYAAYGIPIGAVTPQNEPHAASRYPGGELPARAEARWVTGYLHPALAAARLHTRIYGYDGGASRYPQALLASGAGRSLSGIAWHCYGGPQPMAVLHNQHPRLEQIVSECSPGIVREAVSQILIDSVRNWASSVALWNLALDPAGGPVQRPNVGCKGCTGVVTIDERTHTVTRGLNYYEFGQLSKYVEPGAYRVASSPPAASPLLDQVAFLNPDGTRVLVAYNESGLPITFGVGWRTWSFAYALSAGATVTFRWGP